MSVQQTIAQASEKQRRKLREDPRLYIRNSCSSPERFIVIENVGNTNDRVPYLWEGT